MTDPLKLMCVLAHPDDESLGNGATLVKYAAEGIEVYLVSATRGERGWFGGPKDDPGPTALGRTREAELRAAALVLGLREVSFLDYIDGDLDQVDPAEAVNKIVAHLRRVRPQVVITFGPDGAYGHPDHIAICQFTTAACVLAADPAYGAPAAPHRVSKLYYMVAPKWEIDYYQSLFGELVMNIGGVERRAVPWEDWAITTMIECADCAPKVWEAVACHKSQLPGYGKLKDLPEADHRRLWGKRPYYRAFSLVNGGRKRESDLFEGLR